MRKNLAISAVALVVGCLFSPIVRGGESVYEGGPVTAPEGG